MDAFDIIDKEEYEAQNGASAPTRFASEESSARRWLLTINNTENRHDEFIAIIQEDIKHLIYACMSDEIGLESHIYHTHIFLSFSQPKHFSTIKSYFKEAHIDVCVGTSAQCREYIFKLGKWEANKKSETNIKMSHYEYGKLEDNQGKRTDLEKIKDMVEDGASNYQIKKNINSAFRYGNYINQYREEIKEDKYRNAIRNIKCIYIFGIPGSGKTSYIREHFPNCYMTSPGQHLFDTYNGQECINFDDFRDNQIDCASMLRYLDIYPLMLPCRFHNKVACYENIFITSNVPIDKIYSDVDTLTRSAFIRRIHEYYKFDMDYIYRYEYIDNKWVVVDKILNKWSSENREFAALLASVDWKNFQPNFEEDYD